MSEQTGSESSNGASGVGRPSTRAARLQMVRQLLADNVVTSQAQLSELLAREGFPVTQATMSRDLDEVNAAKTRLADGTIAYAVADQVPLATVPESNGQGRGEQQLAKILTGLVVSVAHASNFVIVHTPAAQHSMWPAASTSIRLTGCWERSPATIRYSSSVRMTPQLVAEPNGCSESHLDREIACRK